MADLVKRDQEVFRSNVLKLDNAFSTYSTSICEEEMGETKGSQLEPVLNRLGNLVNKSPNVSQPSFTPKDNSGDFTAFREFLLHFEVFTRNVKLDEDKLYFLKTCVKSGAQVKLKHLELNPSNYKVA